MSEIEYEKAHKTILFIDGIEFEKPTDLGEYLILGITGLFLLITLPFWIWFYFAGKLFVSASREKQIPVLHYICPNCKNKIKEIGNLLRIECICGWYGYLDHIDIKTEVKNRK